MKRILFLFAALLIFSGCVNFGSMTGKNRISRVFCWGVPKTDAEAAKYAAAGVTDIRATNAKQCEWVIKYGMTPYCGTFTPAGPHPQVMTPEEETYHKYINGGDLSKKMAVAERKKIIDQRRREKNHRYGGDMINPIDTINTAKLKCFASDKDLVLARRKIDGILAKAPAGVKGIYIDYIGYTNHRGCYCRDCLKRYQKYLRARKLADTPENRDDFFRQTLVNYYNDIVDYIKSKRPEFKIVAHIYPEFNPDPLYGNRTKVDYCGQTVSWYFKWKPEKISGYTSIVTEKANDFFPGVQGIPFIGLNINSKSSLGYKTPADVENELKTIIATGADTLMVCTGSAMLAPGYFEVFKKYCK